MFLMPGNASTIAKCGKCRILKGKDAEVLYADYIEGKRTYMDVTLEIRNKSY